MAISKAGSDLQVVKCTDVEQQIKIFNLFLVNTVFNNSLLALTMLYELSMLFVIASLMFGESFFLHCPQPCASARGQPAFALERSCQMYTTFMVQLLCMCAAAGADVVLNVRSDGSGDFSSVQAALDSTAPDPDLGHVTLYLQGSFWERVHVYSNFTGGVTFIGTGTEPLSSLIAFNVSGSSGPGTFGSWTMKIEANDVQLYNLAIANSADNYNHEQAGQSVALDIESDRVALYSVWLLGAQDTLYTGRQRNYFKDCFINGTVDAIFGSGGSVFDSATIRMNYTVTAHKGGEPQPGAGRSAYLFLAADVDGIDGRTGELLLGRPWGPQAQTVWINSRMGSGIGGPGWDDWGHGCTVSPPAPGTTWCNETYYAEYSSSGPGAEPSRRVWWSYQLTSGEAAQWTPAYVLGDWTPPTLADILHGSKRVQDSSVAKGQWIQVDPGSKVCDVTAYGAKGDGRSDDTKAVQSALNDCGNGSGTVVLPVGGTFLTSGVKVSGFAALVVSVQGTWLFSNDTAHWDQQYTACMAYEKGASLALTGGGTVDGNGYAWWAEAGKTGFRPGLVTTNGITEVLITDVYFKDSPNHNLELYSTRQEVWKVNVTASHPCQNPPNPDPSFCAHNTDAVDTHNSDASWVHDCSFSVGDDNVAIHGNNTLVEGCTMGYGHGASIGSLGTETYLRNITVRDTVFQGTEQAVRIKADPDATGYLRDVLYTNLSMRDVGMTLMLTMFYPQPDPSKKSSLKISNITFSNITSQDSASAGQFLCATESPCEALLVSHVHHTGTPPPQGWQCQAAFGQALDVSPTLCLQS